MSIRIVQKIPLPFQGFNIQMWFMLAFNLKHNIKKNLDMSIEQTIYTD
jgi:hypothetical protein